MFLLLPFGILFLVILFLIMKIDKKITKKNEIICVIVFLLLCPYIMITYKDGGSKMIWAPAYQLIHWKQLDAGPDSPGRRGWEFHIFPTNFHDLNYWDKKHDNKTVKAEENTAGDEAGKEAENPAMIPYDTERTGDVCGYLFIPIDGKIYRYWNYEDWDGTLTKAKKLFEFSETEFGTETSYYIYEVSEYPDHTVLYCRAVSRNDYMTQTNECTISYLPPKRMADGELEKAVDSGFVVMENGSVAYGREIWQDFYGKVSAGEPASVRIGHYYTLDDEKDTTSDYYEANKGDRPCIFLNELTFDGSQFFISPVHSTEEGYVVYEQAGFDSPASQWKYLMHYTGKPRSMTASFSEYDKYVLVNDDTLTWERIEHGMVSSHFGDFVPFTEVYNEYIMY